MLDALGIYVFYFKYGLTTNQARVEFREIDILKSSGEVNLP